MSSRTLCLIPCFNESYNLPQLFADLEKEDVKSVADILFVDDCSTDDTLKMIQDKGYPVIIHKKNAGYGQAVQSGFTKALADNYDCFIVFPGDHQRQAKDLKLLIKLQKETNFDVITGSKFHIYSEMYGPIKRRLGNRIYSMIAQFGWGSPIMDVLSGFKVYKVNAVAPFFMKLPHGYPFDICFSLYAGRFGLRVMEVPVDCRYDEHTSKMRSVLWVSIKMLWQVIYHFVKQPIRSPARKYKMGRV